MANKLYTVLKDGVKLKEVKSLAAAKKLADTEGAQVFSDGRCVYKGIKELTDLTEANAVEEKGTSSKTLPEGSAPEKYVLTALMNIRKAPSKSAEKTGTAKRGTVVEVAAVKGDWLCLTDGNFILYDGGRFARKKW